ncbi:hypothetical protein CEXT_265601 [Caerostris extrusa]|uniref:Uncharacterized protein n=1 Tax=Caerostris extrusa TaxID=172846 RepID=A0AAV4MZD6_CAEEX|nr:hypothetical protein CEXT_265601 [Caerostris extrusa]
MAIPSARGRGRLADLSHSMVIVYHNGCPIPSQSDFLSKPFQLNQCAINNLRAQDSIGAVWRNPRRHKSDRPCSPVDYRRDSLPRFYDAGFRTWRGFATTPATLLREGQFRTLVPFHRDPLFSNKQSGISNERQNLWKRFDGPRIGSHCSSRQHTSWSKTLTYPFVIMGL